MMFEDRIKVVVGNDLPLGIRMRTSNGRVHYDVNPSDVTNISVYAGTRRDKATKITTVTKDGCVLRFVVPKTLMPKVGLYGIWVECTYRGINAAISYAERIEMVGSSDLSSVDFALISTIQEKEHHHHHHHHHEDAFPFFPKHPNEPIRPIQRDNIFELEGLFIPVEYTDQEVDTLKASLNTAIAQYNTSKAAADAEKLALTNIVTSSDITTAKADITGKIGTNTDASSTTTLFGWFKKLFGELTSTSYGLSKIMATLMSNTYGLSKINSSSSAAAASSNTASTNTSLIKNRVGTSTDSTSADTLFGRLNYLKENSGGTAADITPVQDMLSASVADVVGRPNVIHISGGPSAVLTGNTKVVGSTTYYEWHCVATGDNVYTTTLAVSAGTPYYEDPSVSTLADDEGDSIESVEYITLGKALSKIDSLRQQVGDFGTSNSAAEIANISQELGKLGSPAEGQPQTIFEAIAAGGGGGASSIREVTTEEINEMMNRILNSNEQ